MTAKLEQAARQALDTSLRVDQYSEEMLGDDGMVMVVPLDAYNDMMEAISTLQEALDHSVEVNEMVQPVSQERIEEHCALMARNDAVVKESLTTQEQEPVAVVEVTYGREPECYVTGNIDDFPEGVFKLYAAPVRTKDLTDDEILRCVKSQSIIETVRRAITADREKNK